MKGIGVQRDRSNAIAMLVDAADQGDEKAKRMLRRARLYRFLFGKRSKSI